MMACLLKNVVNNGTGGRAKDRRTFYCRQDGHDKREHDAWFVGFTYLVAGVYVGYDQIQSLGRLEQGGRTAAPIFTAIIAQIEDFYPADDFVAPEGITMQGNLAYRSDMPMEGASALSGGDVPAADGQSPSVPGVPSAPDTSGKRRRHNAPDVLIMMNYGSLVVLVTPKGRRHIKVLEGGTVVALQRRLSLHENPLPLITAPSP